jgi:hypothetical protein
MQQHKPTAAEPHPPPVAQACHPSPLKHNQQLPSQFQAPNAKNSSLNDRFKVVATVFQQVMTELNGAESEEERIVAITKIVLKLTKKGGTR